MGRWKLEKGYCSCFAVHCEGRQSREPQTCTTLTDVSKEQSDSEKHRSMRKSDAETYGSQCRKGYVRSFQYGFVHKPASSHEAMKVPEAKAAVDKEWENKEHSRIGREGGEIKVSSHPSSGERWKNSSLRKLDRPLSLEERRTFKTPPKGRVVLRGDNVEHEDGYRAVFAVQGAAASQMAAAKFLDTISKLPGMAGKTSDAVSAYTQVKMTEQCGVWLRPDQIAMNRIRTALAAF